MLWINLKKTPHLYLNCKKTKQIIQCNILHEKDNWLPHYVNPKMFLFFKDNFYGLFEHYSWLVGHAALRTQKTPHETIMLFQ